MSASSIGTARSASLNRTYSPDAARTPVRTAAPFPRVASWTYLTRGHRETYSRTIAFVASVLALSTTSTSVAQGLDLAYETIRSSVADSLRASL